MNRLLATPQTARVAVIALVAFLATSVSTPGAATPRPRTYAETVWPLSSVGTFRNHHNASGVGPRIAANETVKVSCRVYDPFIESANPSGWWYRIASAPWRNRFYSPANTFLNGDPRNGPYRRTVDLRVPRCR